MGTRATGSKLNAEWKLVLRLRGTSVYWSGMCNVTHCSVFGGMYWRPE